MIKNKIKEALTEFFSSEEGRALIVKAVKTAMIYDLELEKHRPDNTIERVKRSGDILVYLSAWIKKTEGALRGCQQDVQKVKNLIFNPKDKFLITKKEEYKQITNRD